jgi:hypothetical protein
MPSIDLYIKEDQPTHQIDGSLEVKGTNAAPFYLEKVQNIAPVAVHLKEVNHIDPISVESLFISQVRNIEPLSVEKFNVTNLPLVNMALRQMPPVELNIRQLPAVSIGLHQVLDLRSNYQVGARVLGLELFRIELAGRTRIAPTERFRQEQDRADNRSFPKVASAGNPAIPSIQSVKSETFCPAPHAPHTGGHHGLRAGQGEYHGRARQGLRVCQGGGR